MSLLLIVEECSVFQVVVHRSPFVVDLLNEKGDLVTQINAGGKLKVSRSFRSVTGFASIYFID